MRCAALWFSPRRELLIPILTSHSPTDQRRSPSEQLRRDIERYATVSLSLPLLSKLDEKVVYILTPCVYRV